MKKFIITETRPATYTWTYEVEANSEEEAMALVFNQEADIIDSDVEIDYNDDGEYEVIDEQ